jgi:hypothetical protein
MVEGLLATVAKAMDMDEPLEVLAGEAEEAIAAAMDERDIGRTSAPPAMRSWP